MTTAMTDEETAKVDLTEVTSEAPKRRGRPPGSKNRPKDTVTPRRVTVPTATATSEAHAVLVTDEGIEVLHADGTSETFKVSIAGVPLFDRRK